MPTVLYVEGWRFFFYSDEGNEPIHIHCQKAEKECKYWLDVDNFDIQEAYSYNMIGRDKRQLTKILYDNFGLIKMKWELFKKGTDEKTLPQS